MAAKTGVDGNVTVPTGEGLLGTTKLEIFKWSATASRDIHDVTHFAASVTTGREKVGGMMHITGTFEAYFTGKKIDLAKMQEANHAPTAGMVLSFEQATVRNWTFTAILSNINIVTEKTGLIIVTASFESSWKSGSAIAVT